MSLDSATTPVERAEAIKKIVYQQNLSWRALEQTNPKDLIQHLFIGKTTIPFNLIRHMPKNGNGEAPLSDHPALIYSLRLPPISTQQHIHLVSTSAPDKDLASTSRQFYLKFLDNNETLEAIQEVMIATLSTLPPLNKIIQLGQKWAFESPNEFHQKAQLLVSEISSCIETAILVCAEQFLGSYDIQKEKLRPIKTDDFLHRSGRGSESLRVYKRSLRGSSEVSSSVLISRNPDISPEEDCIQFYQDTYGKRDGMIESQNSTSHLAAERKELIHEWLQASAWTSEISVEEIQLALKSYPTVKARGVDGISPILLKKLDRKGKLSNFLHILFNACIFLGQTPQKWNHAIITTIPKDVNDSQTVDKRRPISVTPMIRRIFEKAYLQKIDLSMDDSFGPRNYDFYIGQAGFRKQYSTYSNAIALHEAMIRGENQVVFVDLKQAYDRVDVEHLLVKMKNKDICPRFRNLVRSLYTEGVSSVIVNKEVCGPFSKYSGLMQGGLWSPVLFSFYIDDLGSEGHFKEDTTPQYTIPLKLFADDIAIIRPGKILTPQLQQDVTVIEDWCEGNSMQMNAKKSAILDGLETSMGIQNIQLSNGNHLPVVETYKYLGFPFTKKGLNLVMLLEGGTKKAKDAFYRAKMSGSTWPQWMRYHIYRSFIQSRWEYGAPLIHQALLSNPSRSLQKAFGELMSLEAECLQWIFGAGQTKVILPARNLLGTTSLQDRFADLHTMFVQHMKDISSDRTELHSVLKKVKKDFIPPLPSLLSRLFVNPTYKTYLAQAQGWRQEPRDWVINGVVVKSWTVDMIPEKPPSLKLHIRLMRQVEYRNASAMMSLVRDGGRTGGNGVGMDTSLFIPLATIRALAIRWRLNIFSHRQRCPKHHRPLTRSCIHSCNLLDQCQDISVKQQERFNLNREHYEQNPQGKPASCYTILDDLLNFNEWKSFAKAVCFLFRQTQTEIATIDKIETELGEFLELQSSFPYSMVPSSQNEGFDNG
jgi:hypothetical protein